VSGPLLSAQGLVKHFVARRSALGRPISTVKAVDGVDLHVGAGETVALVGESGCGKSTVGRLLLRLLEPTAGRVIFDGQDIHALSGRDLRAQRRHMQLIFQDPFASLNPRMTVYDTIAEPLALHRLVPSSRRRDRVAELMTRVGLKPEQATRYPHEFSGGQRQRIVIARALASEPKLIVCDEPVSALDVSIRAQILNLLRDLQRQLGLALVFISHDLAVVKHIADRVAVMYLGRIVETASGDQLFDDPKHPYTRALLSAIPIPSPAARRNRQILQGDVPSPIDPPPGCHLHQRCPHVIDRCRVERPQLLPTGEGRTAACHRALELPPAGRIMPVEAESDPRVAALIARFAQGPAPIEA
jgi:peptide/nickel transport system ATP-binding protein/oligopeptide transport system ATP-binding protein